MSSILDALRKVEAEKTQKKVDLGEIDEMLAEQDLVVAQEEGQRQRVVTKERVTLVLVLLAVVGLSAVIGSFLYLASQRGRSTPGSERQTGAQAPVTVIEPAVPRPPVVPIEQALPREVPKPPEPVPDQPAVAVRETPKDTSAVPMPVPPTPTPPRAPVSPVEVARTVPAQQQPVPVSVPKQSVQRPVLKINILRAPSEEFPEPLAVVNKKKVRVGDSVDGAKVIKIQSDGIVFEYENETFLVQF